MLSPSLRSELFKSNESGIPYASVKVENIADAINANADVKALQQSFVDAFGGFDDMLHEHLITNIMSVNEMKEQDAIAEDIFRRLKHIVLVDKYTAYQALADNWQQIVGDIETIQTEGIDAVRVVESAYKIIKKDGEEIEVADGVKGRVIPFELVQIEKFRSELDSISGKQAQIEDITSQLEELRNNFSEEEAVAYLDEDDNTKFNKNAIKADAKTKVNDIEAETKAKLKQIVALWDKSSKLGKEIKADKAALETKTIVAIEHLSDEEVDMFLHKKWIAPICEDIVSILAAVLNTFEKAVLSLAAKYAESYNDIETHIADNLEQLAKLIGQLTGDEFSIKGLNNLIEK